MEWISVKERLPEKSDYYIACQKKVERSIELYFRADTGEWIVRDDGGDDCIARGITHWMPLPEPPQ